MQNEGTRKVMGLYEVENLDIANLCTIAINPKEYFEKFKDRKINKKHKGVIRDTPSMTFESNIERISSLRQLDTKSEKKLIQKRLQVKNTNMIITSVNKVKFTSLNDKRYYGPDGILLLPFGHPLLNEVREYKKSLQKIHTVIEHEKDKILFLQNKAFGKNERLRLLRSIFAQPLTYYRLKETVPLKVRKIDQTSTKDYILNSKSSLWKVMYIKVNLMVIF